MKKKKERILGTPKKRGKFFTFFKGFLRIFTRKPKIINLNDKIEDRAIYLSNHSGSSGPFTLEMFFPKYLSPGAPMRCAEATATDGNIFITSI